MTEHDPNEDPKRFVFSEGLGHVDFVRALGEGTAECPGTGEKEIEVVDADASEGLIFPWQKDEHEESSSITEAQKEAMAAD